MSHRREKGIYNNVVPSSTVESSPLCKDQPGTDQLPPLLTVLALELHVYVDSYLKYLLHSSPGDVLCLAEQVLLGHVGFLTLEPVNTII